MRKRLPAFGPESFVIRSPVTSPALVRGPRLARVDAPSSTSARVGVFPCQSVVEGSNLFPSRPTSPLPSFGLSAFLVNSARIR